MFDDELVHSPGPQCEDEYHHPPDPRFDDELVHSPGPECEDEH